MSLLGLAFAAYQQGVYQKCTRQNNLKYLLLLLHASLIPKPKESAAGRMGTHANAATTELCSLSLLA